MTGVELLGWLGLGLVVLVLLGWMMSPSSSSSVSSKTKRREGLTNASSTQDAKTTASVSAGGEAGLADDYAQAVSARVVQLQDTLLVSKYRASYEAAVLSLDEYLALSQLQQALHLPLSSAADPSALETLVTLQKARDSLTAVMTTLDKQP